MSTLAKPPASTATFADALLTPRSIALIGASSDQKKNTSRPLRFMRQHGYTGSIYPINPAATEILGVKAYPSVAQVPHAIDHAFIMIPGKHVIGALKECAEKGIRVATIYSDGFAEAGAEGQARQEQLVAEAKKLGIRILGPNSIGTANAHTGGVLSVNAVFEMESLIQGSISLVSQSGSMMGSLLSRAAARGFGFAKSVSVGNESDISVGEVVDALVDDPQTHVILLFLETLRDTGTLTAALRRARQAGKPVIAYKLGRSEQGDALAQSHTGAIAGNNAAVDAYFDAMGVMRIEMLETLFEAAPLASRYAAARPGSRSMQAARVAVITTTGGGAASVVDSLGLRNIEAATPPLEFLRHMAARGLNIRQTPVIDLTLAATSEQYKDLLEQLLLSDWCDAVLSVVGSSAQFHPQLAVKPLIESAKPDAKPLAVFLAPEANESLKLLQQHGIAAFRTPEACADALAAFFKPVIEQTDLPSGSADLPADCPGSGNFTEVESIRAFAALGIQSAASQLLQPAHLQHAISYPLVLKVVSRDILHKTDVGGVKVNIKTDAELKKAVPELLQSVQGHRPQAKIDGVLVQKMEGHLIELMLGYRHDPLVGPTVLLSTGGIAAELMPDYAIRLAPVGLSEAHAMIKEVQHCKLINGYRGLPKGDVDGLAQAIVNISRLACVPGQPVTEAEINPLFVQAERVIAVDGVIRLKD
ncbi:acetate--CoA ligase family protein [Pollutimonas sp. M17]|uniref:acetate--CoA ligase family protein n=1 Tax=Pollutimonas sp. M17 TaxID=2962065 RepID=UPI0021F3DFAA|nr:acetate--CoA ligase family protein [Pollutimonas sp. M17]UYO95133.1 acetate--CoA ligase family protein [Pollutimonas sp. M17]